MALMTRCEHGMPPTNIFSERSKKEGMNLTLKNIVVLNDGFGAISIPLIAKNSVITLRTQQPQRTQSDKMNRRDNMLTSHFEFIRLSRFLKILLQTYVSSKSPRASTS